MRLICNGIALDLSTGAKIQLKKQNPLFSFDKMSCERTTEFALPDSPANNRAFSLSKDPAYRGEGMRRRFPAQLQVGTCVKDGYLYVSTYTKGEYKAVFVSGEYLGLQRIKEAGKIADIIDSNDYIILSAADPVPAGNMQQGDFARVDYQHYEGRVLPSINLQSLANKTAAALGVTIDYGQEFDDEALYRIVPPTPCKIENKAHAFKMQNGALEDMLGIITRQACRSKVYNMRAYIDEGGEMEYEVVSVLEDNQLIEWKSTDYDLALSFPDNFPDKYFLISGDTDHTTAINLGTQFLGGWSFAVDGRGSDKFVTFGTPLAGRKVSISKGTPFVLLSTDYFTAPTNAAVGTTYRIGFENTNTVSYTFTLEVTTESEGGDGLKVPYIGIVPGCTFVDLLKSMCALSGTAINYDSTGGGKITLDPLALNSWPVVCLDGKVQSVSKVERTFSDYAQVNNVLFDSGEMVRIGDQIRRKYLIDNDCIEAERDLEKIVFSEGATRGTGFYLNNAGKMYALDKYFLASSYIAGEQYMGRVTLKTNASIERLCDSSTSVEVNVRLTVAEYEAITNGTRILYAGTLYVWTDSNWSDGVATFTLAKI